MNQVNFDERLHVDFHEGRAHDESVMRLWREAIRRHVGDRCGLNILDLGSGTGRFSYVLADEFESRVVGVEPSDKMRAVAEEQCRDPRIAFLKGDAESIPLGDDSCEVVWMSQIVHHLPDFDDTARELRRVLKPLGMVIVRNNFKDRLDGFCRYYEFFPSALMVDEARHPTIGHLEDCFGRQGFRLKTLETIEQMEAASLRDYAKRIRLRTYSTFELISESEFEDGLRALEQAARAESVETPVTARIDLLVFERQQD